MKERVKNKNEVQVKRIIAKEKKVYNELIKNSGIVKTDKPFHSTDFGKKDYNDELNLYNPYSAISCFIVYLYSMEFGDPPFYAELNTAVRKMDMTKLEMFGPFLQSLFDITYCAENNRDPDDQIQTGLKLK